MNDLQTNTNIDVDVLSDPLTAEEITFSRLVAKGITPTRAYRSAFPSSVNLAYGTVRNKASQLMTKHDIITEVATSQTTMARMTRLAEDRLEEILVEGDITDKNNKVAEVGMFMYEQANGKAIQKTIVQGQHVVVTYNLGGDDAGEVPQHILDQLEDD